MGARSFEVRHEEEDCFAQTTAIAAALGKSQGSFRGFLSKRGIATVKSKQWKRRLAVKGKVRFLNRAAIEKVLKDRLEGPTLRNALSALARDPPVVEEGEEEEEEDIAEEEAATRALEPVVVVPLVLPKLAKWWSLKKYEVGPRYGLMDNEIAPALKGQLERCTLYWTGERVLGRDGDSLSVETLSKRRGRICTFLGFLKLIGAAAVQDLNLSACMNVDAVNVSSSLDLELSF